MKKTFIFGLMAAALGFTACSNDDDLNVINNNHKGMVLRATVEQPAETRATIDDSEATWKFAFATDDNVSVTNSVAAGTYYTFTNDGTDFKSEDAQTTATDATWYAYFPSNEVSLVGQSGTMSDVANKYALAGKTESATTGKDGLSITMSPKVAILKIYNNTGSIDVNVKISATEWVKGLTASEDGFTVAKETSKQTLLSATEKGIYYVAVPAGVQISVKNGDTTIKSTGTNGLAAGKYYELAIGSPESSTGSASATGITDGVKWVQLWEGGPKFAEFNVGATSATNYGGYYAWGGSANQSNDDYNKSTVDLTDAYDTATKLWGNNWRMPTQAELQGLLDNCTVEWTDNYNSTGIKGRIFTGNGAYSSNSIFLPAAGYSYDGEVYEKGDASGMTSYWSSTYRDSNSAYILYLSEMKVGYGGRAIGRSVRAVLKEAPATTGTAEATINGVKTNVNWVQLWANGTKFAEYNVGVSDGKAESYGGYYTWGGTYNNDPNLPGFSWTDDHNTTNTGSGDLTGDDDTATNLWGSNWRMPTKDELQGLLDNCTVEWTTVGGVSGRKFTGKAEPYSSNSVFFPAAGYCSSSGVDAQGSFGRYWSSTPKGNEAAYDLAFGLGGQFMNFDIRDDIGCSVRAVRAEN